MWPCPTPGRPESPNLDGSPVLAFTMSDVLALIKAGDGVDGYGLENHAGRIVDVTGPPSATRP